MVAHKHSVLRSIQAPSWVCALHRPARDPVPVAAPTRQSVGAETIHDSVRYRSPSSQRVCLHSASARDLAQNQPAFRHPVILKGEVGLRGTSCHAITSRIVVPSPGVYVYGLCSLCWLGGIESDCVCGMGSPTAKLLWSLFLLEATRHTSDVQHGPWAHKLIKIGISGWEARHVWRRTLTREAATCVRMPRQRRLVWKSSPHGDGGLDPQGLTSRMSHPMPARLNCIISVQQTYSQRFRRARDLEAALAKAEGNVLVEGAGDVFGFGPQA